MKILESVTSVACHDWREKCDPVCARWGRRKLEKVAKRWMILNKIEKRGGREILGGGVEEQCLRDDGAQVEDGDGDWVGGGWWWHHLPEEKLWPRQPWSRCCHRKLVEFMDPDIMEKLEKLEVEEEETGGFKFLFWKVSCQGEVCVPFPTALSALIKKEPYGLPAMLKWMLASTRKGEGGVSVSCAIVNSPSPIFMFDSTGQLLAHLSC